MHDEIKLYFIHETIKKEDRITTRSDLIKHYNEIFKAYSDDFDNAINDNRELLQEYRLGVNNRIPTVDYDTDETTYIKFMILIYYLVKRDPETMEWFLPFFCYFEEYLFRGFFDCAKRVAQESRKGVAKFDFGTNVEKLKEWQLFVLHLYVKVHCKVLSRQCVEEYGKNRFGVNSCFTFLTLLKYFMEQKEIEKLKKYIMEGIVLKIFLFWSYFMNFFIFDPPLFDAVLSYYNHHFGNIANLLVEYMYSFTLSVEKSISNESATQIAKLLLHRANNEDTTWEIYRNLLKADYLEVKDLDSMAIISDEKAKNNGKYAWTIKQKILLNVRRLLCAEHDFDNLYVKIQTMLPYKDLLFQCLQETEIRAKTLMNMALTTSLMYIKCLNETRNDLDIADDILKFWKSYLFSNIPFLKTSALMMFTHYLSKDFPCSDDLAGTIIDAHPHFLMDMKSFSTLTNQLVRTLKKNNIEKTGNQDILEKLKVMVHYYYESIVIRDTLECVKDLKEYQPDLKDEDTEKLHIHNIICSYEIFQYTYCLLKYMDQPFIENILLHIKTKTEIMVNSNNFKEYLLVFPYLSWMNEIILQTDKSTLLRVFDKLDYYIVLTRLIRISISNNCYLEEGLILVGNLSDIDILNQCPVLEDQRNLYNLEDAIFTHINHQIDNCFYYLLGIESVNYNTAAVLCSFIKWLQVLKRIIQNEITRNGERAISLFDVVRDRLVHILNTINGEAFCTPLAESIQMILLAVCCKRMTSLAPLLAQFLDSIYPLVLSTEKPSQHYFLYYNFLELLEHLLDNEMLVVGPFEIFFVRNLPTMSSFPLYLKSFSERVTFKILSLKEDWSDEEEEEEDD